MIHEFRFYILCVEIIDNNNYIDLITHIIGETKDVIQIQILHATYFRNKTHSSYTLSKNLSDPTKIVCKHSTMGEPEHSSLLGARFHIRLWDSTKSANPNILIIITSTLWEMP